MNWKLYIRWGGAVLTGLYQAGFAQPGLVPLTTTVLGTVSDTGTKAGIAFATVALRSAHDSVLVKATITDSIGQYTLAEIPAGLYRVGVTTVGYQSFTSPVFEALPGRPNPQPVGLTSDATTLSEVSVRGRRPLVEKKFDRLVFSIENTILATGSNALDVLGCTPGVILTDEDKLTVRGKNNIIVMVDDRVVPVTGDNLTNFLKSMASDGIVATEVINASAKYDASVSYLLNIRTKKGRSDGFTGSANVSYGRSAYDKFNTGTNLFYKLGRWNLYGNYAYTNNRNFYESHTLKKYYNPDGVAIQAIDHVKESNSRSHDAKFSADYRLAARHTAGVVVEGGLATPSSQQTNNLAFQRAIGRTDSILQSVGTASNRTRFLNVNLNYIGKLDSAGRELTFNADYGFDLYRSQAQITAHLLNAEGFTQAWRESIRSRPAANTHYQTLKLDYTHPLPKRWTLESGLKVSHVNTVNTLQFEQLTGGVWQNDPGRTNDFQYQENVQAAYSTLRGSRPNWQWQAGLRMERTHVDLLSATTQTNARRDFTNAFPDLRIERKLGDRHSVAVGYRRSIQRPAYDNLNPFIYYLNKYSYFQGNPQLRPAYSSGFDATYSFDERISLILNYDNTQNTFYETFEQNNQTNTTRYFITNIAGSRQWTAGLSLPVSPTKWWDMTADLYAGIWTYHDPSLFGGFRTVGRGGSFSMSHTIALPTGIKVDLSGRYVFPSWYGTVYQLSNYYLNLSVVKPILHQQATLKLVASDLLRTRRYAYVVDFRNQFEREESRKDTRQIRLTLTYRFSSKNKVAGREHTVGSESEQGRINHNH